MFIVRHDEKARHVHDRRGCFATDAAVEIAGAVWDLATVGHTTSGTFGAAMNAAGSAGDPWSTPLPGSYTSGTAGYAVGTNLNATVSSRSTHSASDVWAVGTRILTAGTNIVLAKGVGVTGFTDITTAQVNTEVLDVFTVDTFSQPGQESPAATQTLGVMLSYLYKAWRNKSTQTSTEYALYADNSSTKDQESVVSDDTVTLTRGKVTTGA